jgi:hypothetical protein
LVNYVGISYTDRSGEQSLKIGDRVRLADVNFDTADQPDAVTAGQRVQLKTSVGGGQAGDVYEYVGTTDLEAPAFDDQNFKNTGLWKLVQGKAGKTYVYKGSGRSADLANENFNATGNWLLIDVGQLADIGYGLAAALTASDGGAAAFGGLVVRNDLRSDVKSSVQDQTLEIGGDVSVTAQENAAIIAIDSSTVAAKDLGLNLVIATNTVLGSSLAWIANSDVTTTSISSPTQAIAGDLTVSSDSRALISAELTSKVEASVSVGIVLAFNTIGYAPQDLLRNVVDGVLGIGLAGEQKAATKAWISNSRLNLGGALSVTADWAGSINAVVNNSALAISVTSTSNSQDNGSKNAISVAPVVAMNKISADVAAYVDAGSLGQSVSALGDITIESHSSTRINAEVAASAVAIAASTKASAVSVSIGLSLSRNDVSSDVKAYVAGASLAARPTMTSEQGSIRIGVWRESQIIANGSGSHHELRKLDSRLTLMKNATKRCGGAYLFANQRGCDGNRLYFDGSSLVCLNGELIAQASQFSLKDVEVITAVVDLDSIRSYRGGTASLQEQASRTVQMPHIDLRHFSLRINSQHQPDITSEMIESKPLKSRIHTPEEECCQGPACWLWDYLRRSGASGFMLPLSGGADSSSVAAIATSKTALMTAAAALLTSL